MALTMVCKACGAIVEATAAGACPECGADLHRTWPSNAGLVICPVDGIAHQYGCRHWRENPQLVPGSLRGYYQEQWGVERSIKTKIIVTGRKAAKA